MVEKVVNALVLTQLRPGDLGNRSISTSATSNVSISGFVGGQDNDLPVTSNSSIRGIAGSFIHGTAPNRAGSFQRSVTSVDYSQRFYDTLMPDLLGAVQRHLSRWI